MFHLLEAPLSHACILHPGALRISTPGGALHFTTQVACLTEAEAESAVGTNGGKKERVLSADAYRALAAKVCPLFAALLPNCPVIISTDVLNT